MEGNVSGYYAIAEKCPDCVDGFIGDDMCFTCRGEGMQSRTIIKRQHEHNATLLAAIRDALHELRMSDDDYAGRASRAELALSMALDAIGEED
jgi:hypothetical protein